MKEIITYRYHIHNGASWEQSPYPGYSTQKECWNAAYTRVQELRKKGLHKFQVTFIDEVRTFKEEQA